MKVRVCLHFYYADVQSFTKSLSSMYVSQTTDLSVDLTDKNTLFKTLQENTHIRLPKYFNLQTQHDKNAMVSVFGVDSLWYRQEFAKSRGMHVSLARSLMDVR